MSKLSTQYYFTKVDPDYSIKGSRDPLGFQVIWQHQGKELIPFLSTVSSGLQDFQIMCMAYYYYGKEPDNGFVKYFLRFEQLMAYTRFVPGGRNGFNGIDKVRRILNESTRVSISNSTNDDILSNQRTYGIWGKYNRPFQEIGFVADNEFNEIFGAKFNSLPDKEPANKILIKILQTGQLKIDVTDLKCLKPLLQFGKKEIEYFDRNLLKVNTVHPYQNIIYSFLQTKSIPEEFNLYGFLKLFRNYLSPADIQLKSIINDIEATEKVLSPLNTIFRYLQTKPIWNKEEIENDDYIEQCKNNSEYIFHGGTEDAKLKNQLSQTLKKNNWALVQDLVARNSEVTGWRGGVSWLTLQNDLLEVHHADGGFKDPKYIPSKHFNKRYNNGYFIDTYIRLFQQINKA